MRHGAGGVPGEASRDPELASLPSGKRVAKLRSARLYVITPDSSPQRVLEVVAAAVRGGAEVVQLRHKVLPRGELLELARDARRAARDILLIVNDHVDIALLAEADGVHLGPDDLSVAGARRAGGDKLLIGASAATVEAARAAIAAGADYLGCGPAFPTPVKKEKRVIGPQGIAEISAAAGDAVPVFAIGGIDQTNVGELTAMGLRRACVIRAVGDAPDPEQAVRTMRAMLDA